MTDRRETARIETEAAARWCSNILHEVLDKHAQEVPESREHMREALHHLVMIGIEIRDARK